MKNRHILRILATIWVIANSLDPRPRKVWVNIEADNISAESAEASHHVAQAVESALYEVMLFILANQSDERIVRTADVEIEAEASTHTATLTRTVLPMDTATEAAPETTTVDKYSLDVERYINRLMDDIRGEIAEMLKSLAAAHFEDTDGGEGDGYVVTRRSLTPEP